MTKEELVSKFPDELTDPMVFFNISFACLAAVLLFAVIAKICNYYEKFEITSQVVLLISVVFFLLSFTGPLSLIDEQAKYNTDMETWRTFHLKKYMETLPETELEFEQLVYTSAENDYRVQITDNGVRKELNVEEIEFTGFEPVKVIGKEVTGLKEYGIEDGYLGVKVFFPAVKEAIVQN